MTHLLLIEPKATGHHMQHVRRIIHEGTRQGMQIQLLTERDTLAHTSYQLIQEEYEGKFETVFFPEDSLASRLLKSKNQFANQLGWYRYFQKYCRLCQGSKRPDVIFVPYVDYIDKAVALLGSPFAKTPWACLPMQYKFHYQSMGAIRPSSRSDIFKQWTFLRLLNNHTLAAMFTIDELLYDYTRKYHPKMVDKLHYVGDPVDMVIHSTRDEARERLGLPKADRLLLIYGALSLRKGVAEIIESTKSAIFPEQVSLVFAGAQYNDARQYLQGSQASLLKNQGRLFEIDRFLSATEESDVFRASDIVWLGYKEFYGMSGVMIQAGHMDLPTIACREGLIGWMTRKYQNGIDIDISSPEDVASAIARLVDQPELAAQYGENGLRLASNCTSEAFSSIICRTLIQAAASMNKRSQ